MRRSHRRDPHDLDHGVPRPIQIHRGRAERDRHVLLPLHGHRARRHLLG